MLGAGLYEQLQFLRHAGYWPCIRQPRSFNEKILYRKLFDNLSIASVLADKWGVREFVAQCIGKDILNEVFFIGEDIDSIDINVLPNQFVAKGTHGSGADYLIFVKDKTTFDVLRFRAQARAILQRRCGINHNEFHYARIKPQIMIERLLVDDLYGIPLDYKFFVFHGTVKYIQVDYDRYGNHTRTLYDRDWMPQKFSVCYPRGPETSAPSRLADMIAIAERLAKGFDFLRIDLYCVNDNDIFFGEITWTPESGRAPFTPRRYDFVLGELW